MTDPIPSDPSTPALAAAVPAAGATRLPAGKLAVVISANRMFYPMDLCFSGFLGMLEDPKDVVLVDNASKGKEIAAWGRRHFPAVTIVERDTDGHYCGGFNSGLRWAMEHGHEFALLVNADT